MDREIIIEDEKFLTLMAENMGKTLIKVRKEKNLTREEVSSKCNITVQTIYNMERNSHNFNMYSLTEYLTTLMKIED